MNMKKIVNNFRNFLKESEEKVSASPAEDKKRNFNLAKDAINNEGYQFKEKGNTLIVYSDNREQTLDELRKLLEPQGFVHNPIGGGSTMGRLEIKDSNYGNAYVMFKPIRRTAALVGNDYETQLANQIIDNFSEEGITAKTAGPGVGPDLTILVNEDPLVTIEVKTKMGADFGQFKAKYDIASNQWLPMRTKSFIKNEAIFSPLAEKYIIPWLNQNASFANLNDPRLNIKNNQVVGLSPSLKTNELKKELQSDWFDNKTDIKIPFDFSEISSFYHDKGDSFIQIGNAGLYALSKEASELTGLPLFSDLPINSNLRIRIKPHAGPNGTHTFTTAVKLSGRFDKSKLNLSNLEDMKKFISTLNQKS